MDVRQKFSSEIFNVAEQTPLTLTPNESLEVMPPVPIQIAALLFPSGCNVFWALCGGEQSPMDSTPRPKA